MSAISFSGNTNLGMIRTNNEDAFVVQNIWDEHHVLAVAIDGVGGYEGGEVAAAIAQKCIVEYLEKYSVYSPTFIAVVPMANDMNC